ncbi:S4 domain-containing protein YaaA [Desmospora profundinema]|uniref:S4 domain protein YaaA n=1 Tax=Desmospora profundinema TaxID=1571184 RepID=A0ABU1IKQ2_9BACL|nr:S4 domain-containing protein YaaA [Desmospora profundinema]MDR6225362.1 S4 domain protein YaaA [Desmospora profundinema]
MQNVRIHSDTITLGQLLKKLNLLGTGGQAKWFLHEYRVTVNDEVETRRGRKLTPDDIVEIEGSGRFRLVRE